MGSTVLAILGSLGGVVIFVGAIWAIIRAGLRQVSATEDNTKATKDNTAAIEGLKTKVGELDRTVAIQGERIDNQGGQIDRLRTTINERPK
jgi:hypothetical protein